MSASGDKFACTSCGATFVTPWPNCPICNAAMAAEGGGSGPAPTSPGAGAGPARLNLNFNFPGGPGGPDTSQEPQLFASAPASPSATPYQQPTTTGTSRLDEIFQSSASDTAPKPNFASFSFGGAPKPGAAPATPAPATPGPSGSEGGGAGGKGSSLGGKPSFGGGESAPAAKSSFGADDPFKGPSTPGGKKPEFKPMNFGGGSPGAAPASGPTPGVEPSAPKPRAFEPPKPLAPLAPKPAAPAKPPVDDALARSLALLDSLESSKVSAILPSQAYLASRPVPAPPAGPVVTEGDSHVLPSDPTPPAAAVAAAAAATELPPVVEPPAAPRPTIPSRPPLRPIPTGRSGPGSDHALSSMNRLWPAKDEADVDPHADVLPGEEDSAPPHEEEEKKGGVGAVLGVLAAVVVFLAFTATALIYGVYNLASIPPSTASTDVGTLAAAGSTAAEASSTKSAPTVSGSPAAASTVAGSKAPAETAAAVGTPAPPPAGTAAPPAGTAAASAATGAPSDSAAPPGTGAASATSGTVAANTSGRPSGGPIRQQIWDAMESEIPEVAAAASKKIAAEQGKTAVPKLVDMLKNSNKSGRTWAARTLTQIGADSAEAAEALAKNLPRGGEETTASVEALTAIGPPSLPLVLGLLRNPDAVRPVETQLAALEVIQNVGPKGTLLVSPAVLPFLESTNPDLRETSKATLKKLGPGSMSVGADAWREGSAAMRKSLCEVWASYGPEAKSACPQLGEVLKTNDEELFRHAAHTLYKIGPASLPTLFDVLENAKNRKARDEASKAVGWIGEPAVKPALDQLDAWIRSGKSAYDDPVGYLLSSLGRMGAGGKAALPKLAEWARHPNGNISFYARDSLDKIQRAKP